MPELDPLPSYTVRVHRLDPTLAELHIEFADLPADVEVRGRLIGPCCPGSSTIEVAYHRPTIKARRQYKRFVSPTDFLDGRSSMRLRRPLEFRGRMGSWSTLLRFWGAQTTTARPPAPLNIKA